MYSPHVAFAKDVTNFCCPLRLRTAPQFDSTRLLAVTSCLNKQSHQTIALKNSPVRKRQAKLAPAASSISFKISAGVLVDFLIVTFVGLIPLRVILWLSTNVIHPKSSSVAPALFISHCLTIARSFSASSKGPGS
ncbi:hypothetical protein ARMSODRAFT_519705 [Armillaria solidipes]|uniref:Uncharacterized protein n=1 Tax=Armillaria solidipes TaxID=1076256 RepID=A0A2H3BH25_9AGAR|nr:hypothetical protein ARMSODRAFT_519705 [Armillaria solidipes]